MLHYHLIVVFFSCLQRVMGALVKNVCVEGDGVG